MALIQIIKKRQERPFDEQTVSKKHPQNLTFFQNKKKSN